MEGVVDMRALSGKRNPYPGKLGVIEPGDLPESDLRVNREDRPWIELLGPMLHAGGNKDKLFIGRRLQPWLDQVRIRSVERSAGCGQSRVRRRCVTRCGRAASAPRRSTLLAS